MEGEQKHLSYVEAQAIQGTGLLCGEVIFHHQGSNSLLDQFPPFFVIEKEANNQWLNAILDLIVVENQLSQPASKSIINHLSELLFTYAIRQYLEDNPDNSGMLRVYNDPKLMKAIQCIHENPHIHWTLMNLSKEAGLSRTLFAERFKSVSGWTPGQYLLWWRMQIAWSLLNQGELVSRVAEKVGYQSDASFSRAFSKTFAISAGKVRRKA